MANFIDGTPTVTNKNVTDFTINVKTDAGATVRYLLVPAGATAPTASEVNRGVSNVPNDIIDTTGLFAHWNINNASTTDLSGNNINLTTVGTPAKTTDKDNILDGACICNNTEYFKTINQYSMPNYWSASIWLKLQNDLTPRTFFTISAGYRGLDFCLHAYANNIQIYTPTIGNDNTNTTKITDSNYYHHIVFTQNTDGLRFYINGIPQLWQTGGYVRTATPIFDSSLRNIFLGCGYHDPGSAYMDEVRFYSRAITNQEALTLYIAGVNTLSIRSGQITTLANTLASRVVG